MLEILALWALTKRIGAIVEQKGHKSGGYKLLTVVLWFGGEILGAILGVAMASGSSSMQCTVYIVALMGAAAGAFAAYLIANNLSPMNQPPQAIPAAAPVASTPNMTDMGSYYGLTSVGEDKIEYSGPLEEIPLEGKDVVDVIKQVLEQTPSAHLLLVPSLGLLIVIRSSADFRGLHFRSPMDRSTASEFVSLMLLKGKKVDMLEKYGALELL